MVKGVGPSSQPNNQVVLSPAKQAAFVSLWLAAAVFSFPGGPIRFDNSAAICTIQQNAIPTDFSLKLRMTEIARKSYHLLVLGSKLWFLRQTLGMAQAALIASVA